MARPRLTALVALAVLLAGCGAGQAPRSRLTMHVLHMRQADERYNINYWQYLPSGRVHKPPVLIFLHGYGEEGPDDDPFNLRLVLLHGPPQLVDEGDDLCFEVDGRRSCFLLLAPQALPGHDWYDQASVVPIVERLIDRARALGGDMHRVYLTGLSMGGAGTWTFAGGIEWDRGGQVGGHALAAMLVDSGVGDSFTGCRIAGSGVAVWAFHGTADDVLDPLGDIGAVRAVNACRKPRPRTPALLTLLRGVGHNTWDYVYSPKSRFDPLTGKPDPKGVNVYQWLLSHQRS